MFLINMDFASLVGKGKNNPPNIFSSTSLPFTIDAFINNFLKNKAILIFYDTFYVS